MEKIENKRFEIKIDSGLDEKTADIINRYWKFNGTKFSEVAGQIGSDHGIPYTKLLPIIRKNSKAYVIDYCHDCNDQIKIEVRSQSSFLFFYNVINMCSDCNKIREDKIERKINEIIDTHPVDFGLSFETELKLLKTRKMKRIAALVLLMSTQLANSQSLEITEATDDELKEYLAVTHHAFKENQENYYEKTRLWGFEFAIFYEDKPIYRGDILKPYFASPRMYHNQNNSKYSLRIQFLIPLDGLDRETQLQLREHEKLMLVKGSNEKNYISPKPEFTIATNENYKNEFATYKDLTDKVSIKIYKTVLKN